MPTGHLHPQLSTNSCAECTYHKQRTLEPPALSLRTMETYVPLRAEGSESVPAVVCAFCATSLAKKKLVL